MTLQKILLSFDPKKENLLPLLHEVNKEFGYISKENTYLIADYFKIYPAHIYSVVTASDILKVEKPPKLEIGVCGGAHCKMKGSDKIIQEIENYFKIKVDHDFGSRVSFKTTSCVGQCQGGPVVSINGTLYEKVKPESIDDILKNYI